MANLIPSQLMITDVSITNYHRVYATRSLSGVQLRRDSGIQWFKGEITLQAYGYDNVRLLNGFLANLKGQLNAFELPLKGAYVNKGIGSNPKLSMSLNRGSNKIQINHTGSVIGAGSVFTLPNETKLYTLLEDAPKGTGGYSIVPSLKASHSYFETVNFMSPVITAVLDSNETTIRHEGNGQLASATIAWNELIK